MPAQLIDVKMKSGGQVTLRVMIGQAQWGTYKAYLWDQDGKNPTLIDRRYSGDAMAEEATTCSIRTQSIGLTKGSSLIP